MKKQGICIGILVAVFLFHLLTLRAGQPWPDDFAMYVHEAKNFVEGVPLSHTGYIFDPYNKALGPKLYPPIFPVLLTPGYAIGGLRNLEPMQVEIVLFFTGTLIVLWLGLGSELPPLACAALLALVGFNPIVWGYKDLILSDIPFTFLFYLALLCTDRLAKDVDTPKPRIWLTLASAALIYLSYGTRTIGVALIPAALLCGVLCLYWRRKNGKYVAAAGVIAVIPCLIQSRLLAGQTNYGDQLAPNLSALVHTIIQNAVVYSRSLAEFWGNPYTNAGRDFMFLCLTALALLGYIDTIRRRVRVYEIVVPIYMAILLAFPLPDGTRYLLPIFPLYVWYMLRGLLLLQERRNAIRLTPAVASLMLIIFACYATEYAHASFGPFNDGVYKKESSELFSFIDTRTQPGDVFIFRRPRALALFTGRDSAIYPAQPGSQLSEDYLRSIGATYMLEAPSLDDPQFDRLLASSCVPKQLVFHNADFTLFRVEPGEWRGCDSVETAGNSPAALP